VKSNFFMSNYKSSEFPNLAIFNIIILILLLFTAPRDDFDSTISYFGMDQLGDDSIAIVMLLLLSFYTLIKTDSNQTFFNQLSILLFSVSVTLVYLFADVDQVNPAYIYGLLTVFAIFIINIYIQGFRFKILERKVNTVSQIFGAIGLFLALLLLAFWALPFVKTTKEMFGGGTWAGSDKSILVTECCGLADFGTYNLISESIMYSLLILVFILQISGFSVPVFAKISALLAAFFSIIRTLGSIGSGPFIPEDSSVWTQELLNKYRPTETVSPTLAFYMFAFICLLIVLNISIAYILNAANTKSNQVITRED
jgi:hypothetical protein